MFKRTVLKIRKQFGLGCNGDVSKLISPSGKVVVYICECDSWSIEVDNRSCSGPDFKHFKTIVDPFIQDLRHVGLTIEADELQGIAEQIGPND